MECSEETDVVGKLTMWKMCGFDISGDNVTVFFEDLPTSRRKAKVGG